MLLSRITKIVFVLSFVLVNSVHSETCPLSYALDEKSVKVGWTGFKTTDKVAVSGEFSKFKLSKSTSAASVPELLQSLEIEIDKTSVITGLPERDKALTDAFFNKLNESITAKVKSAASDRQSFIMELKFNGIVKDVVMNYSSTDDKNFSASGTIDILQFAGDQVLASLNQRCFDLHKGSDGISKTWSEVQLTVSAIVNESCR